MNWCFNFKFIQINRFRNDLIELFFYFLCPFFTGAYLLGNEFNFDFNNDFNVYYES